MSGNSIFVDTNILIYALEGNDIITRNIAGKEIYISEITEVELLGMYQISKKEIELIKKLLAECYIVNFNGEIKETAISIKQKFNIKLPDAIIAASCIYLDLPFFTTDKGFRKISSALDSVIIEI